MDANMFYHQIKKEIPFKPIAMSPVLKEFQPQKRSLSSASPRNISPKKVNINSNPRNLPLKAIVDHAQIEEQLKA